MTALVVDYAPGGKSRPHRHGQVFLWSAMCSSGAIRSRVGNGEERVYHAGEYWTEKPGVHHTVSENASDTEPGEITGHFRGGYEMIKISSRSTNHERMT